MDRQTRKQALRHAAKVAFGSLFTVGLGCGGALLEAQSEDARSRSDAHSASDDASTAKRDASVVADGPLRCVGRTEIDASDVGDAAFQCCVDEVKQALGNDASDFPDRIPGDPSAVNCCNAIIARIDTGANPQDRATAGGGVVNQCCSALGWPSVGPAFACTPWGPPTPPPMNWEVA